MARTRSKRERTNRGRPAQADPVVLVHAFNPDRGDFDALEARRIEPDVYEITSTPAGGPLALGDHVRCELSDGELVVREQVWRTRLL